jgi:hypothetical protein
MCSDGRPFGEKLEGSTAPRVKVGRPTDLGEQRQRLGLGDRAEPTVTCCHQLVASDGFDMTVPLITVRNPPQMRPPPLVCFSFFLSFPSGTGRIISRRPRHNSDKHQLWVSVIASTHRHVHPAHHRLKVLTPKIPVQEMLLFYCAMLVVFLSANCLPRGVVPSSLGRSSP